MLVDLVNLKLSAQRGLLGNVFPQLRAVSVNSAENLITICFYIDGDITSSEKELCESVLDDITSDFSVVKSDKGKNLEFEAPIIRLDYPEKLPLVGQWVYYRNEP